MKRNRQKRSWKKRAGAALVEFAVVSPVMVLFTFGLIEMGRMTLVRQMITNISREGARIAVLPGATNTSVQTTVASQMTSANFNGSTITITPANITTAASGSNITVSVSIPAANVSWLPTPKFMLGRTLVSSTTMRKESM